MEYTPPRSRDDEPQKWATVMNHERKGRRVHAAQGLMEHSNAWVPLGKAADGLPLLLSVRRAVTVIDAVLEQVGVDEVDQLPADVNEKLLSLEASVRDVRRRVGIQTSGPIGEGPCFVPLLSVQHLVGATMMTRLIGGQSPLSDSQGRYQRHNPDQVLAARTCAGVMLSVREREQVMRQLNSTQLLVLPLTGDTTPQVLRIQDKQVAEVRPLFCESLVHLKSARWHACWSVATEPKRNKQKWREIRVDGELADQRAYRRALHKAHYVAHSVARTDLMQIIAEVARHVDDTLHRTGRIHCDIKPDNLFIDAGGGRVHDGLDVPEGRVATAGTTGWNAPEQVLARPVCPATDVFALAQLAVKVLQGVIFGDEQSYMIPIGNGQRERMYLIGKPDVYLDPTAVELTDAGVAAWRAFFQQCLALDADERLNSAKEFATRLMELTEAHPPPGRVPAPLGMGVLHHYERFEGLPYYGEELEKNGPVSGAWVVEDQWTPWAKPHPDYRASQTQKLHRSFAA
jgi:hypothetical protein